MRWNGFLATTITALLAVASPAAASTYSVTGTADVTGSCVGTACTSIRAAIAAAAENPGPDVVGLEGRGYELASGPLQIGSAVTLRGTSARATVITGAPGVRVVEITGTSATVAHLTLSGGTATPATDYFGGTLTANTSSVLLDHVRVTNGRAYSGGGIANRNGSMTIRNSLIDHNQATDGGGDGGAIINFGGNGGAAAALTIQDSTVAFNTANLAGGIISRGNTANSLTFESVTLAFNNAGTVGGLYVPSADGGAFTTRGSLFAHNFASGGGGNCNAPGLVSGGANLDDGTDCALAGPGDRSDTSSGLSDGFANLGGETDVLSFPGGSPALDIGGQCSATDQTDFRRPVGVGCDAGAWERHAVAITSGPEGPTTVTRPTFEFSGYDPSGYVCELRPVFPAGACSSPWVSEPLADGTYAFRVEAPDDSWSERTFTVDTVAPDAPGVSDQHAFTAEPGATFECALDGAAFAGCASPYSTAGLAPGEHTLTVRAIDAAGNVSAPTAHRFAIASQQPVPTPVPTAVPTPTPTPTPTPEPVRNKSVAADPQGTVLIKDKSGKFVPLADGLVANGSEIDAKRGAVTITTSTGEKATFSAGRFKIAQSGGITTATLSEPLDCKTARRGKARAAASKPKTRKLWGDGKGKFRTKGSYSAATVRGTKWLVQDTCTTTSTRVAQGVVSVRDDVLKRSFTVRKGKSYTARAKKR